MSKKIITIVEFTIKDLFVDKNFCVVETYRRCDITGELTAERKAAIRAELDKL